MLRKNLTREKLKAGGVAIGARLDFTSPYLVEMLGGLGLDFVYFDLEHGPTGEEACQEMIRAAELAGLTPLVRVPFTEPGLVGRFLDSGAAGIIFPHCNTADDARAAVRTVKYPPQGERGMGGRSLGLSGMPPADYISAANSETMVVAMIEEQEALHNLPGIVAVDGLDVMWVGRLDFSVSAGVPGKLDASPVQEAVERIMKEGTAAGKVVGVGAVNADRPDEIRAFIGRGARFFSLNTTSILRSAARDAVNKIRS